MPVLTVLQMADVRLVWKCKRSGSVPDMSRQVWHSPSILLSHRQDSAHTSVCPFLATLL